MIDGQVDATVVYMLESKDVVPAKGALHRVEAKSGSLCGSGPRMRGHCKGRCFGAAKTCAWPMYALAETVSKLLLWLEAGSGLAMLA